MTERLISAGDYAGKKAAVRIGRFLFRSRNFIATPIFLFLLCAFFSEYENDLVVWTTGPAIICAGEALRLWAMRHIGRSARTRKDKARRLVVSGPYAFIRNPLYVGNHLTLAGFCVLSEMLWFVPMALSICFVFYSFIVIYEEDLLKRRFGDEYARYAAETSRWIPLPKLNKLFGREWREAFFRERSTIYGLLAGILSFALKELAFS
ncbi:MAG: isoprenylcysteine carboxylmethyltransferase family protein [Candidatus Abyssobacteria bacterium SURF_5]|uniref:Isoprenylcysteine carboxylmethyltransferase family protein n=1 Tax=Abyssobacteria bacterium (strain SURF_5) TaxID=2093360 RepID=A0A3A4NJN4_ABYX5|nr:MAG: isoprenylcysteine carboxylmethyltransferase family protein [Candidatus Abyssubacteria bacterium SURF_5]